MSHLDYRVLLTLLKIKISYLCSGAGVGWGHTNSLWFCASQRGPCCFLQSKWMQENNLTLNREWLQQRIYRYHPHVSRTLFSRTLGLLLIFFHLCLNWITPQRACPNKEQRPSKDLALIDSLCLLKGTWRWLLTWRRLQRCSVSHWDKPLSDKHEDNKDHFSFFCLLSCNPAQGKKGSYFLQLSFRRFYCGIGHIFFSKVSMGLNAGAGTQIPLSPLIRDMQFILPRTKGGGGGRGEGRP